MALLSGKARRVSGLEKRTHCFQLREIYVYKDMKNNGCDKVGPTVQSGNTVIEVIYNYIKYS